MAKGYCFDSILLNSAATGERRVWEIHPKSAGILAIGLIVWKPKHRAFQFRPFHRADLIDDPSFSAQLLSDLGKFCQRQTDSQLAHKVAAAG